MPYLRELEVALAAARLAAEAALPYFDRGIAAEQKPDDSPVTEADRAVERTVARFLSETCPDDGILGEEGASKPSRSGRRWIVDPIDGTRDFVRGNRMWCNLISLEAEGEVVAGVACFPALRETYYASRGSGAFLDGTRLRVSAIDRVTEAVICVSRYNVLDRVPFGERLREWMHGAWAARSFGGALDAMMVASGKAELWLEYSLKPWDIASIQVIAEEAGGTFLNFDGGRSIHGGNCLVCTPAIEAEVRRVTGITAPR
jgi:histidinol-phosphatase